MTEELPEGIDPNDPLFRFVSGLFEIVTVEEGAPEEEIDPEGLRSDVEALIAELPMPPRVIGVSGEEQARRLMEQVWESADEPAAVALQALRLWPRCADAFVVLGYELGEQPEMAFVLHTLGAMAARELLPDELFEAAIGRMWEEETAQPLLRALEGLARTQLAMGETETAAMMFVELLNLNPSDEQEVRYPLLALGLELRNDEVVEKVLESFAADHSAEMLYARALWAFQREGDSEAAREALAAAAHANTHVPRFMLGRERLPETGEEMLPGSAGEGAMIAATFLDAFQATPGALDWLQRMERGEFTAEEAAAPAPAKQRRSGPRSID